VSYRIVIRYTTGGGAGRERVSTRYSDPPFARELVEPVHDSTGRVVDGRLVGPRKGRRVFRRESVQREGERVLGATYVEDRIEWEPAA
jgi:hypothetical protein